MTKLRVPDSHAGPTRLRVPDTYAGPVRHRVPDGAPATGTITVNMTGAPTDSAWSLSPDPGGGNGSGAYGDPEFPNWSFSAPPEDYTLTWEDTAFPYTPPPPEGPLTLVAGGQIDFGPP